MRIGMYYLMQVPKTWTPESEVNRYWEMIEDIEQIMVEGMISLDSGGYV